MPAAVLHQAVVEALGQAITNHEVRAGEAVLLEDVVTRLNVSRSVAREAVRVLETLGMVAVKRRVGNVVQPRS
ncbi:MAG TPA: GntR family transcriptional regulator, partial [Propionibacteriaceae bacterium]|nr:GntR family transcriptional regulator [Propionibacteriaceae bacterium]